MEKVNPLKQKVNLEAERARLGLTKEALSAKLRISSKTYLSYVRGDTPIPSDVLERMAGLFKCSTDYLLGLDRQE